MSGLSDTSSETCRTCLAYFDVNTGKYSLTNCSAITADSGRLELMRNVMSTCSLTLFAGQDDHEGPEIFICKACVTEIDQMLAFLQKCIRSETILKQAADVKTEKNWTEDVPEGSEDALQPKLEIKVEAHSREGTSPFFEEFSSDDVARHSCGESPKRNGEDEPKHECHKTFPSALSLAFHRYKHVGCKPHACVVCHESFRTLRLVQKHMAVEHGSAHYQPFPCRQCPDVFGSKYRLTRHECRIHNAKVYSCTTCKRTFSTVSSLKFHENIHLGLRPYSCGLCSKSFASTSVLRDHKKNVHSEMKQFECHCGRSFNRKKKLELHVESVHEKKDKLRKHPCPECDKKFHHPYSLKNHINTHLGIKPFLCNVCGSAFTALSNLTSHFRRVHSGEKRPAVKMYLCHTCGDSFARASHLKRHTLRKHVPNAEKKHECPVCKKKFLEKSDVTGHVKLHDDLKPFVCDQCTKCFRTAWRLQAHVNRVHLGLRPFECPTCSLKFKTKSHLEKHIRTHTGEKPFPCPHCAYACAEKSNLKKHINIHLKGT